MSSASGETRARWPLAEALGVSAAYVTSAPRASMHIYLASGSDNGALAVAAIVLSVFTALVAGLSYFNVAAAGTKKAWLDRGLDAYAGLLSWRFLWERAQAGHSDAESLWSQLFDARAATALHQAALYGESATLGDAYHRASRAAIETYEPAVLAVLAAGTEEETINATGIALDTSEAEAARRHYLTQLKRSASYYRVLRRWHSKWQLPDPPDWL